MTPVGTKGCMQFSVTAALNSADAVTVLGLYSRNVVITQARVYAPPVVYTLDNAVIKSYSESDRPSGATVSMTLIEQKFSVNAGTNTTTTGEPSGRTFEADVARNVLASALAAGIALPYSCRTGNCQTCRARIAAGEVDHGATNRQFLSDADKAAGYALLCQARPLTDIRIEATEIAGLGATKPRVLPCRVVRIEWPAPDVTILELRLPPNDQFRFVAGQYLEFILEGGKRRAYSIASVPKADGVTRLELHVRHTPGGLFTERVFSTLREKELLRIEGPLGTFVLRDDEAPIVFVAAGTGFAPIKSMLEDAFARGIHRQRPIVLYWGARTRAGLYLSDAVERWASEEPNFRFVPVLSEPTAACAWQGRTGFVHEAVLADLPNLSAYHVYACGSPLMVEAARRDFRTQGKLHEDAFFADEFLTEADRLTAAPTTQGERP
jgi:CDP-4-dehydro-6-deoxyglucose reductase